MVETKSKLNHDLIKKISKIKNEPKWMTDFRLNSLDCFLSKRNPSFGPELKIDFDLITYYKRISDGIVDDWNKVDCSVKKTFDEIGLPEAEKNICLVLEPSMKVK